MAQFETTHSRKSSGNKYKRSGKTPLIDFTPMVDLAFLLITFFMLTTAMREPFSMKLHMPEENGAPENISAYRSLTLIADKENTLWFYIGDDPTQIKQIDFSREGLRDLLYTNITRVKEYSSGKKDLICLIKLNDGANYQDLIDLLDEMEIVNIGTYALQDVTSDEKEHILINNQK